MLPRLSRLTAIGLAASASATASPVIAVSLFVVVDCAVDLITLSKASVSFGLISPISGDQRQSTTNPQEIEAVEFELFQLLAFITVP